MGLWIFLSGSMINLVFSWNFIISGIVLSIIGFWRAVVLSNRKKQPEDRKNWNILED